MFLGIFVCEIAICYDIFQYLCKAIWLLGYRFVRYLVAKVQKWYRLQQATKGINLKTTSVMNAAKIGENAGLIWCALENGALSTKAIKKATKLKEADLNLALGWLARENKIAFEETATEVLVSLL